MPNELRFDGKVAIVTGAGNGLGRSHALLLASRGAKVIVNDLGGGAHGDGKSSAAADNVVAEIKAAGGEGAANYDSVEAGDKIVQCALDNFGRIDVVVNNAGILRDTSFQKMSEQDWELIYRVHVLGSFRVTHAAWSRMRDQKYGRIVMTASAAGIYGNFGQANYSMAKLGLVGFANTLALEGKKANVHVNTIAPIAGSRLTETVMPKDLTDALKPEYVSPLVAWLCHEECEETGGLFEVGGGFMGKLRWERAEGHSFKLGRDIPVDAVKKTWSKIVDFGKTTHPADITASMAPVMANLNSKSRGGNEFIDLDQALGFELPEYQSHYDERDLSLYALGIGAAKNPLDPTDLKLVYEMHGEGFQPLPTFGVIPALSGLIQMAVEGKQAPGLNYGFERLLHGEQYLEMKRPLPRKANLKHRAKIKDIFDKGKNALVITEIKTFDDAGNELCTNEITSFVRGAGGWGGDRGPTSDTNVAPDRAADGIVTEKTDDNQALLYRLSGDWNPLHADPAFAQNFGFQKPILHGLCTFGFAARHVIKTFCPNGDPRYFKSIKVRFADSVFPGETLKTEMWKESDTRIVFRTKVVERDSVVISNAAVELWKELPSDKPKAAAAPAAAAAAPAAAPAGEPTSADVFAGMGWYVGQHPELATSIQTVYQFKLSGPDSAYVLDLKNGKGSVAPGTVDKPDCTLALSNDDFMAMVAGKADPQKLFFGGKLKITGNIMASQKLTFLQKIDAETVKKAAAALGKSAPAAAAPAAAAPAAAPPGEPTAADVFAGMGWYVGENPDLAAKIQTVYQFKLSGPDSAYVLDLKNGKGSVTPGTVDKPDCTLALSNDDFMGMVSGKADPQKLFFGGKLKITGNIMASQKLTFLQKIDAETVKKGAAAIAAKGGAAPAAAAPAASSKPKAADVFAKVRDVFGKSPALAGDVGGILQFKVKEPDGAWVVDCVSAPPSVREGTDPGATTTLTLAEEDLMALAGGADARDLFQHGKLRVDGDVRPAHKLGFLKA